MLHDFWTLNRFLINTLEADCIDDFAVRLTRFAPFARTLFDMVSHHFGETAPKPKLQSMLHILPFFLSKLVRRGLEFSSCSLQVASG